MTITSKKTHYGHKSPERTYPYMGINSEGLVILFNAPETGMVLFGRTVGYWSDGWAESHFKEFFGEIRIEVEQ